MFFFFVSQDWFVWKQTLTLLWCHLFIRVKTKIVQKRHIWVVTKYFIASDPGVQKCNCSCYFFGCFLKDVMVRFWSTLIFMFFSPFTVHTTLTAPIPQDRVGSSAPVHFASWKQPTYPSVQRPHKSRPLASHTSYIGLQTTLQREYGPVPRVTAVPWLPARLVYPGHQWCG